jgi:hypothetical protein
MASIENGVLFKRSVSFTPPQPILVTLLVQPVLSFDGVYHSEQNNKFIQWLYQNVKEH